MLELGYKSVGGSYPRNGQQPFILSLQQASLQAGDVQLLCKELPQWW